MTIAILATGDEIVHGDTLNTNGRDIAHVLSSEGLSLGFHMSCSDKEADIVEGLRFLSQHHDTIIIIGGLGPTKDDLTRFALAKWIGQPLVQHQEALEHVQNRLLKSQVAINEGNLQQCLFPQSAVLLPNPHGSAVGCFLQIDNKSYFLLPGPPRECNPMFLQYVLPLLTEQMRRSSKQILKWRIFGLAESEIAEVLEKALQGLDCQTGYRLDVPYIEFKVRCKPELVAQVKTIIDPIIAPHCISVGDKKASECLRSLIVSRNQGLSIRDEVTGGLLETLLLQPKTHGLIHCHQHKDSNMHFYLHGLNEYWLGQQPQGKTQVTIHYGNPHQEGKETHHLPYRSPLVVHYAAEWLSFRLFHLINQLH